MALKMMKVLPRFLGTLTILFASSVFADGDADSGSGKVAICAACHGAAGNSTIALYPNLAGQGEKYLLKQLKDVQSGARPILEMTGMLVAFNDQDLEDIAAYFSSLDPVVMGSQAIADEAYALSAEEFLALGEKVFRGGNMKTGVAACTGCHSPSGAGNDPAGYPSIAGQHTDYIVKQLTNFQRNLRINDGESMAMRAVAGPMSDLEIRAVANYLSGLN
jgi:cytochrome c553